MLLMMVMMMMMVVNWRRQLGQFRGRSGSMLMADDATGRGTDHRGGGRFAGRSRRAGTTGRGGGGDSARRKMMRMVVMFRAETGRGGGLAGALLLVFGLQYSELRFGSLQFDGFLFELK